MRRVAKWNFKCHVLRHALKGSQGFTRSDLPLTLLAESLERDGLRIKKEQEDRALRTRVMRAARIADRQIMQENCTW
jgi:hypothetical protein